MKRITFLFMLQLLFIIYSCSPSKEKVAQLSEKELLLANNDTAFDPSKRSGQMVFTKGMTEVGLDMPELKTHLTDEEIGNVTEVIINKPGTTKKEMIRAMTLLNRMKKEDYEKAYILYLEKGEPVLEKRIQFYKALFKHARKYEKSFKRLPEETQIELQQLTLKELGKSK